MPKEEWGVKRVCPNCSTRFYDLQRDPMTCPSCGHSVALDVLLGNKTKPAVADRSAKAQKEEVVEEDEDVLEDDDADVDLGDDVLEDDDDDTVDLDDITDVAADDDDES